MIIILYLSESIWKDSTLILCFDLDEFAHLYRLQVGAIRVSVFHSVEE